MVSRKRRQFVSPVTNWTSRAISRPAPERSVLFLSPLRLPDIHCGHFCFKLGMSPLFAADWNDTSTISTIKHGLQKTMGRSEGMASVRTWRVVWAELKDFCETVSSKHSGAKAPVLIRPLVLKLPIDFHHGRSWASDQPSSRLPQKLNWAI